MRRLKLNEPIKLLFGALLFLSFILGITFYLLWPSVATSFSFDQSRDASIIQQMRLGHYPEYGPKASRGDYSLPANYYYILFLFGFWTQNPATLVYLSGFSAIASLILIAYILWEGLKESNYRLPTIAICSFLFAINFTSIDLANKIWNPDSVVFWGLLVILSWIKILNSFEKITKEYRILWFGLLVLSTFLLISLHSASLLWVILYDLLNFAWFIKTYGRKYISYVYIFWAVVLLLLMPYFWIDSRHSFQNTLQFIITLKSNRYNFQGFGIWDQLQFTLQNFFYGWFEAWSLTLLPYTYPALVFITSIVCLVSLLWGKKSNFVYRFQIFLAISSYLTIYSNFTGETRSHFLVVLVTLVPLSLGFNFEKLFLNWKTFLVGAVIIISLTNGALENSQRLLSYGVSKYSSSKRDINTKDFEEILDYADSRNSNTICIWNEQNTWRVYPGLQYFNKYFHNSKYNILDNCKSYESALVINVKESGKVLNPVNITNISKVKDEVSYEIWN